MVDESDGDHGLNHLTGNLEKKGKVMADVFEKGKEENSGRDPRLCKYCDCMAVDWFGGEGLCSMHSELLEICRTERLKFGDMAPRAAAIQRWSKVTALREWLDGIRCYWPRTSEERLARWLARVPELAKEAQMDREFAISELTYDEKAYKSPGHYAVFMLKKLDRFVALQGIKLAQKGKAG